MKKNNLILLFSFMLFFSMFSYGNGLWTDLLELKGGTVIKFQFKITDDIPSEEPAVQIIPNELPDQGAPAVLPESITNEEENGGSTEHATPVTDTDANTNTNADTNVNTNADTNVNNDSDTNTNADQENDQDHDQNKNSVSDTDSDADSDKKTDSGTDTDSNSDAGNGLNE